ncbi:MAG TPA: hypothetical protein VGF95_08725 [Solirubrobacteraceae bacterium]|jgi:Tfp pilus assembly protein PilX
MRVSTENSAVARLRNEDGFTMLVTLGVLLVSGLLLTAAFTASSGDIQLSHHSTNHSQAYYAAAAGIQAFENELQKEPNYWETCPELKKTLGSSGSPESYIVKPLPAENPTSGKFTRCETSKPFQSMIEKAGSAAADTFRIEATGEAGNSGPTQASAQKIIATFKVDGFLNYVYFTHYEDEDPELYSAPSGCAEKYYSERPSTCSTIIFTSGDSVNGPMHTDDAAAICGEVSFGRSGRTVDDVVEINGKPYAYNCSGGSYKPKFNTANGESTIGAELLPPESDSSLTQYVLPADEFTGVTHIALEGETIKITNKSVNKGAPESIAWPENGLIYVKNNKGCGFNFGEHYANETLDTSTEESEEATCGTVYVSGRYAKPLTIAAEEDVIIDGEILPSAILKAGETPPANDVATLGLIANDYVRIYHPLEEVEKCSSQGFGKSAKQVCTTTTVNGKGSLTNPWIYAAILATKSSFLVDNYKSGTELGHLNVYGAIAQNYRGIVGQSGSGGTGYLKEYKYDERLAVDEPPYFLQPLNAEWRVIRETSGSSG